MTKKDIKEVALLKKRQELLGLQRMEWSESRSLKIDELWQDILDIDESK